MKKFVCIKRFISMLPAILAMALLLQGCGDDDAVPSSFVFGKWKVNEKLTANDKGNKKLNRMILEFSIDIHKKNFEIKPLENGEGISFNFSGRLPRYFKVLEIDDEHLLIEDMKSQEKLNVRIKGEKQIMFTVPQLKHPLVPKPEPVVMHFSRKKEKKKQKKK
ncbi:MAG: hypothetical protein HOC91_18780 [Nitrospinaceae bacterium]|nr:hypothetical protein [Nitrospinaceae bacterium]MBT3433269.1 hypothetical protein [Nitrospinaceae bacterium]MBT4432560.1 hypothetical protein [Nitrospinaceae bacterium]MBT5367141.1 hypothetical protein [Nitrospinaceae bacterium]MBT6393447.1 hypothetical protein [Nitrospinaceae bacterium]